MVHTQLSKSSFHSPPCACVSSLSHSSSANDSFSTVKEVSISISATSAPIERMAVFIMSIPLSLLLSPSKSISQMVFALFISLHLRAL